MILKVFILYRRRTIILIISILSQVLSLNPTKRRGKDPFLNKHMRDWNIHTHPCPPFLEVSSVVYFGLTSNFELCSQSIHLPCSSTILYKRFRGKTLIPVPSKLLLKK